MREEQLYQLIEFQARKKYKYLFSYKYIPSAILYGREDDDIVSGGDYRTLCHSYHVSVASYEKYYNKRVTLRHGALKDQDFSCHFPNLVGDDYTAERLNEKWMVGVGSYKTFQDGPVYLCVILDLFDLRIVGISIGGYRSHELVEMALDNICIQPEKWYGNVILHCGQNAIYKKKEYAQMVGRYKVSPSMTSKGEVGGNTISVFYSKLKRRAGYHLFNDWQEAIFWMDRELFIYNKKILMKASE